jgi:tetratricopeptide (TPR) repeat protein
VRIRNIWKVRRHQFLLFCTIILMCSMGLACAWGASGEVQYTDLQRAKVYLAAGDFRRAIDACRHEVDVRPTAEAYLYLTYVYQALDAYVESLAKTDQWVALEHLYLSLVTGKPEDLVDTPDVLTRIAKELMQSGARQQADVAAAMASRLDPAVVSMVWPQQTAWRKAKPDGWWFGIPSEWRW